MGEANRKEDFRPVRPDPNQRYNVAIKLHGAEALFFGNAVSVGMDKDGRVVIVATDNGTNHVFPFGSIEYYNFTKI